MRTRPAARPAQALVVEDDPHHRQITAIYLQQAGFEVSTAAGLIEGEERAMALLDRGATGAVLVVLDLMFDSHGSAAEGSVLAHALLRRMGEGTIRRGVIVALSSALTHDRQDRALHAGCHLVLAKPLSLDTATQLRALVELPVRLPLEEPELDPRLQRAIKASQSWAEQMLHDLRAQQQPIVWTEHDAHAVLSLLTRYPRPDMVDEARCSLLLRALGGHDRARGHLRHFAREADEPYQSILYALLAGRELRDIGHLKITRSGSLPFNKSYIYRCYNKIPALVTPWFMQVAPALQRAEQAGGSAPSR